MVPTAPEVLRLFRRYTHTLDKNGSLYDPAGTESWNMQIRYETMKLTMHPTKIGRYIRKASLSDITDQGKCLC